MFNLLFLLTSLAIYWVFRHPFQKDPSEALALMLVLDNGLNGEDRFIEAASGPREKLASLFMLITPGLHHGFDMIIGADRTVFHLRNFIKLLRVF